MSVIDLLWSFRVTNEVALHCTNQSFMIREQATG
jgi:hypothetical protein